MNGRMKQHSSCRVKPEHRSLEQETSCWHMLGNDVDGDDNHDDVKQPLKKEASMQMYSSVVQNPM